MATVIGTLSIIGGLAVIECLLSVDNALALAAIVARLPQHQQKLALRLGLAGAYTMRAGLMFFVGFLISHWWIRIAAAIYLLYLMCKNLGIRRERGKDHPQKTRNLFATICTLELTDLAFSTDNVVTAVAFSSQFWAVCLGVFIGIAAVRLAAGRCIELIKRIPILSKVAYVLVGSVGIQLIAAQLWEIELTEVAKFAAIFAIIAIGVAYARVKPVNRLLKPMFVAIAKAMTKVTMFVERPFALMKTLSTALMHDARI